MFNSEETAEKIRAILEKEFSPVELVIDDQSHHHVGHASAGGGGHFFVTIKSARFNGLMPLARQRLVIESMGSMMDREIHALSMKCVPV